MSIEVTVEIDVDNLTQSESEDFLSELHDQQSTSEQVDDLLKDISIASAIERRWIATTQKKPQRIL